MPFQNVELLIEERTARITLNRPERLNQSAMV